MFIMTKGQITSDSQSIYEGNNFYRNISKLVKWGLVRTKKKFQNENYYILTLKGETQALNLYSYTVEDQQFIKVLETASSNAKLLYHTASENLGKFLTQKMGWADVEGNTQEIIRFQKD